MTAASAIAESYLVRTSKSAQLNAKAKHSMPGGDTRSTAWFPPYPPFAGQGFGAYFEEIGRAHV